MNEYAFSDIQVGMEAGFCVTVTQEMMDAFRTLSGDENPMHTDASFARENGFGGVVVYGLLVSSFYSRLAGMYLPGKYCLLQEVSTQFAKPVFVGDSLSVRGTVVEKSESVRQVVIKAEIRNQDGSKVNRAKIKAGMVR